MPEDTMKLTTVFGSAIAAIGLAACGSTVAPTVSPTLAPTLPATTSPTGTATPTPAATSTPAATPAPQTLVLTETCDSTSRGAYPGTVSFAGGIEGWVFSVYGPGPAPFNYNSKVTSDANGDGTITPVAAVWSTVGAYEYSYAPDGVSSTILGSFAIGACPPSPSWSYATTCAVPGSAQGGSVVITFTGGTPVTVVIDGNTVDVTSNPLTYGPLTVGDHVITVEGNSWQITVAACVPTPQSTPGTGG
jgi:hypothetical protein